jgi:uncharacterized protein with PIN domain
MRTFNGFPYYEAGSTCPYCGRVLELDPKEREVTDYPEDFGDFYYECPECGREGCSECMPCGRGVVCPECEEAE